MDQIRFFFFFQSYGNENGPDSYSQIGFGSQIRLHQRYKTANGSRKRRNYYYIWPITLLELKYIITSARNAAAIAKGMVELRSIIFCSRELTEHDDSAADIILHSMQSYTYMHYCIHST